MYTGCPLATCLKHQKLATLSSCKSFPERAIPTTHLAQRYLDGSSVHTLRGAALLLGLVGPGADAGTLVVHQPVRAHDHVEHAVHAEVELVADVLVLVREVPVLAPAVERRLGRL